MKNTGIMYDSTEKTPTVLPEMEELLPPLTEEQSSALEADIVRNGSYSPIVVNQDMVVIDGHNRMRLCEKHGIPYRMTVFEFEDLLEAKQWALDAQKGRRNLDKWELGKIALKLKPELSARGKANMSIGGRNKNPAPKTNSSPETEAAAEQNGGASQLNDGEAQGFRIRTTPVMEKVNTRQKMAEAVGLSADMMGKIMKIEDHAPDFVKEALDRKEISINQAYLITKTSQCFPENEREEQARIALELAKARDEIQKSDREIDRRAKVAGVFAKAFSACNYLEPTVENVAYWVDFSRMDRLTMEHSLDNAREYAEVFAAIADILQQFLDAGAGDDALTVLARNRADNSTKEEDKSA